VVPATSQATSHLTSIFGNRRTPVRQLADGGSISENWQVPDGITYRDMRIAGALGSLHGYSVCGSHDEKSIPPLWHPEIGGIKHPTRNPIALTLEGVHCPIEEQTLLCLQYPFDILK
jgi:hypothetical protein